MIDLASRGGGGAGGWGGGGGGGGVQLLRARLMRVRLLSCVF